jgi:hypothetical protein
MEEYNSFIVVILFIVAFAILILNGQNISKKINGSSTPDYSISPEKNIPMPPSGRVLK